MSTLNNEEILITFEELCKLEKDDISVCVDKYSALTICEKSSAPPVEIYNIWVQKLFKAYDLQEFFNKDWHRILEYLDKVLREFVKNLNAITNDTAQNHLEQWWLDTHELLKWLETIINNLDIRILSLILTFVLEVIIKTCKFANKRNLKSLCNIQQMVLNLTNNFMYKMPISEVNEFESFNKVISSLCDVGSLISSADIKTSIETWRAVAKLGDKLNNCFKSSPNIKIKNCGNTDEKQWYEKAILGIFKEMYEILNHYKRNTASSNDNLLQVCQFYLKLLRMIIKYSKDKLKIFPATKEFIQVYTLSHHELSETPNSKIDSYINNGLFEILELIYRENNMTEAITQHFKYDVDNFKSCNLVLDFLKVYIENSCKNRFDVRSDIEEILKIYNCICEGPLIFIDNIKYPKILEYFVVLTILDSRNELHKKLCEYVLDSYWIRSYTSMEILNMYYSYTLQQHNSDTSIKCLEFWLQMWNKLNKAANESHGQQKKLTQVLLKTILNNISEAKLLQYNNCNKYENIEIISLMCGKENEQSVQYFLTNLNKNLKKMQERHMNGWVYKELLNLLEICALKPHLINYHLKENIFATFTGLFSLSTSEFPRFCEFFNKCLIYFDRQQEKQLSDKLLKCLMQHEQHCCSIQSIFLIEFLLKQRSQCTKLLQTLKTYHKQNSTIINLLDFTSFSNKETHKRTIDLKIFQDLSMTYQQSNSPNIDQEQIRKKPRLDEGNFSNIKFILSDLNMNSQKLLSFDRSAYDTKDYELLQEIKNNIEKCLTK